MPRLCIISDTHGYHKRLKMPDADILVHAGDFTGSGTLEQTFDFLRWGETLLARGKYKDFVYSDGNHDWLSYRNLELFLEMSKGIGTYLRHSSAVVQGLKFFGSPFQPEFYEWAYNLPRGPALQEKWAEIPADTDVLITHGPPYKILDKVPRTYRTRYDPVDLEPGHVGCVDLLAAVKKIKPKLHCFGHIHGGYGKVEIDGTIYVNGSSCTEEYKPTNEPIVVDL